MHRQFEHLSDDALAAIVKDGLDWDTQGVLPNGVLRIEAERYREKGPVEVAQARKQVREGTLREAAIRWIEKRGHSL